MIKVFVNIQDLKLLFCIREPSSCCYYINFWGYWHSYSGNFCSLWSQASHYNRQCFCKEKKEYLIGYNRGDRRVLFGISRNTCIQVEMTIYHLFSREAKRKYWKIVEKFSKFLICFKMLYTSQERHEDLFDRLEEFVCFVYRAKV